MENKSETIKKLMELKQLYEAGVLTKEELESEKAKLMKPAVAKISEPTTATVTKPVVATSQPETVVSEPKQVDGPTSAKIANDSERKEAPEKSENNILRRIVIVFILIAIGLCIFAYYKKGSDENTTDNRTQVNTANTTSSQQPRTFASLLDQGYAYLKGSIGDTPVSLYLSFFADEKGCGAIEGVLHYDNQPANSVLRICGSNDDDGYLILYEYDGNRQTAGISGTMDGDSFNGSYTAGKVLSFTANVIEGNPTSYEKLAETLSSLYFTDASIIALTDKQVFYIDNIIGHDSANGNIYKINVKNINSGNTSQIAIYNPSQCYYEIKGCMCKDQKITFILEDRGRNSIGSGNYSTEVSQYNIVTGQWKTIAEEMASAEFINEGKKLRVRKAYVINEDEVYSAYDYIWAYDEIIINL